VIDPEGGAPADPTLVRDLLGLTPAKRASPLSSAPVSRRARRRKSSALPREPRAMCSSAYSQSPVFPARAS